MRDTCMCVHVLDQDGDVTSIHFNIKYQASILCQAKITLMGNDCDGVN